VIAIVRFLIIDPGGVPRDDRATELRDPRIEGPLPASLHARRSDRRFATGTPGLA
jgi:hypothetical protein